MTVARRLLAGALAVAAVALMVVVVIGTRAANADRLASLWSQLDRESGAVALAWRADNDPDSLADAAGGVLGVRVTLIDAGGRVLGDSDFDGDALVNLENHASRPEVAAAMRGAAGRDRRVSASTRDERLYVARRTDRGVVRVSVPATMLEEFSDAERARLLRGASLALLAALVAGALLSWAATRPLVQLRDATRAIADGDHTRRPSLRAPGELGDLAAAIHRTAEQLQARAEPRAEEALMHALLDALDEGVVAISSNSEVVRINASARRMLRVRVPLPFSVDHLPRERALREALTAALAGESVEQAEFVSDDRVFSLTARPLIGGGAVLALLDMTPARRLEAIRRDFVANVSHELKTPLTVIRGYAETLDDAVPAASRRSFTKTIVENVGRMQRLVDDLLDLSRIESGGWMPKPVPSDAAVAVAEATASAARAARAKNVAFETRLEADTVFADATALRQVLANLSENAVRHTNTGAVVVFTERSDEGIWVGVRDTGSGITPEHLPRIFERFYRADPGRSREEGGTGLGLAIVRHLAEAHGGRVRAESISGRGTTIAVLFPAAEGDVTSA